MAIEKTLQTRIALKIDTLENWEKSTLGLKKGELALATVAASAGTGLTEPVVMIKVGEDGIKTFKDLSWNLYAKASDVLSACKSEDSLKTFINGVIADAGIATSDAMEALAGRVSAVETSIATLNGEGDGSVAKKIADAIAVLDLANTYAAKEHKHEIADVNGLSDAIAEAKKAGTDVADDLASYKTTNDAAVTANAGAITAIKDGASIDSFKDVEDALAGKQAAGDYATKAEAQGYADAKDDAIAEAKKAGTDANAALEAYKTSNNALVSANTTAISGIKNGTSVNDFAAAETAIADAKKAGTDAQAHSEGVASDLAEEIERAKAAEQANATAASGAKTAADAAQSDLNTFKTTVSNTYETKTDASAKLNDAKKYTDDKIALVMNNSSEAVDSVMELADAMANNADAISALQEIAGSKAAKSELDALTTRVTTLEGEMDTAQADIDAVEEAVATKAAQSDLEALQGTVSGIDTAYKAADTAINAEVAKKANQTDLDATNTQVAAILSRFGTSEDVLVFDCGTSA